MCMDEEYMCRYLFPDLHSHLNSNLPKQSWVMWVADVTWKCCLTLWFSLELEEESQAFVYQSLKSFDRSSPKASKAKVQGKQSKRRTKVNSKQTKSTQPKRCPKCHNRINRCTSDWKVIWQQ